MAIELVTLIPPIDLVNARHSGDLLRQIGTSARSDRFQFLNDGIHTFRHSDMELPQGARIEIMVDGGRGIYRAISFNNAFIVVNGVLTPDGLMVDDHRKGGHSIRLPEDTAIHFIGGKFGGRPHSLYGLVHHIEETGFEEMTVKTADRLIAAMSV